MADEIGDKLLESVSIIVITLVAFSVGAGSERQKVIDAETMHYCAMTRIWHNSDGEFGHQPYSDSISCEDKELPSAGDH